MIRSDVIDYEALGKRIKKYREKRNMTQSDLAHAVRMSNTTISHIEVGSGKPETNTVVKIANALSVTLDMLLCDSLAVAEIPYKHDIAEYMKDCTADELRLIDEAIPPILAAYRRVSVDKIKKILISHPEV